ncbi:MAG: fibronectin type III domain-containing protein [Paludibacteraceae bacterium]|nr:fibronectin type III domain-containing protein [Paludibacteraceae bacterium]
MRKLILLHIALLFCVLAWSQATGIPYSCSFEEEEDLSAWKFNVDASSATDQWVIGSMVHSEGRRSMYISSDGSNPVYGSHPNVVVSYLRFKFPTTTVQQNYDLSFDWKCVGDTDNSYLQVMVCPEDFLTDPTMMYYLNPITHAANANISQTIVNNAFQELGASRMRFVCGKEEWQNVSLSNEIKVSPLLSNYTFAIVFIWVNKNRDDKVTNTSICIDNVQIGSARIKKPQNLQVESLCSDSSLLVSWESTADEFEVQYRKVGTSTWRREDKLTNGVEGFNREGNNCSYILRRITEGSYDIRVQGKSGTLQTIYVYWNQYLVYCPENHCVDFLNFDSPNVECTYGFREGTTPHPGETPYSYKGYIDLGPDAKESRHTRHVDPTEFDPRTDTCLRTVPSGAIASVRLGNWNASYEAEAITYNFTVDAENQGVLIVKYAIVLQKPGEGCGDPEFKMEIFDENGEELEDLCGVPDFTYSKAAEDASWNRTKDGSVVWKDWTTAGVNLQPYAGQTIKVRFTSVDCGAGGHYGYGYFTLDCANAHLETESCGNDAKISCLAPDGFNYKWYNEAGEVVSTSQELKVDPGRQTFTCRVSFVEDTTCFFEVSTVSAPRFPVPEYTWEPVYGDCFSKLKFHNTSHVMNMYDGTETHTNESTSDCHWYFTRLSTGETQESYNWNPLYTCPSEGDSIAVEYITYIGADNACDSTRYDTIVVPNIIPKSTEFHWSTCPESPVKFGDEWFMTDTIYVGIYPNFAGCDSTSTLYLNVWPEIPDTYRHDSICSDGYVIIDGIKYNQPMDNKQFVLKSVHGCDSILFATLTVNERIDAEVNTIPFVCADDGQMYLTFDIAAGQFDSLAITFNTRQLHDTVIYDPTVSTVAIPYPDTITPGHYTATFEFYQFCCGIYKEKRDIELRYRSSIVAQKWNDVLTLLAPAYNGGYEFTAFQWYKNGQPIPGETHSYLYQDLDMNALYYVELTRPDGVVIATCPIQPTYHEQQSDYPTIAKAAQRMPVYSEQSATVWYFTMSGQLYGTCTLPQGYGTLDIPAQPGAYILKAVTSQGQTQAQVLLVE